MPHELDNQSMLLMYLAGELSDDQRRSVEERLAGSVELRAELDDLRGAQGLIADGLAALDASEPLPVSLGVVERRIGRDIAQWQVDRLSRPAPVEAPARHAFAWGRFGAAVAAVLLVGFLIIWSRVPDDFTGGQIKPDEVAKTDQTPESSEQIETALATSYAAPVVNGSSADQLAVAEKELSELESLSQSVAN